MIANSSKELESFHRDGVSFPQFSKLAERHGLIPKAYHPESLEHFLQSCRLVSSQPAKHLVVSFSRPALGQTGVGHFSPIGALANTESGAQMLLVMDVARFKYPAYWVHAHEMFEAMRPIDVVTNLPRGYLILSNSASSKAINGS